MTTTSGPLHVGLLQDTVQFHIPWQGGSYRGYVQAVTGVPPAKHAETGDGMVWWSVPRPADVEVIRGWAERMAADTGFHIWWRCSPTDGHRTSLGMLACPACISEAMFQAARHGR